MLAIQFKDVWEMYRIKFVVDGKSLWENYWALKGISFELEKGQSLGIIGENGAGKSTILKLIAGMLKPDRGEIKINGRVSGLLELGAGFQPELTGKENIYLNAGLFGLNQSQIDQIYEKIINFAELGKFINAPVKYYSQGMFIRLAFAIAIHMDPDILLIDDTLAVGDEYFQKKCIKKIFELKDQEKTIVFVTHDMNILNRICKRALLLKEGRLIKNDSVDKVIPLYSQTSGIKEGIGIIEKNPLRLIFNNGRLFINWQDRLLTPNSGAYTSFVISDKWYNSFQADWEVKRESENDLLAIGKFYQLALTQIWRLGLKDNYEINWDIYIDSRESIEIQEGFTNIMLIPEYTDWFTTLEKGEFPIINNKSWQTLLEDHIFRKFIGVKTKENFNDKIPSLVLQQSGYDPFTFAQISNTDYLNNCRVLQYRKLNIRNYSPGSAGNIIYFSGKIILDIKDTDNYLLSIEEENILSKDKLRLIFDKGSLIIYYDGLNLTKANHINTALFINERWFSSTTAHWEIKKEGNKLIACGNWIDLPLTHIWEIEITDNSSFLWKVSNQIHQNICLEQQYLYIACSSNYTHWFSKYGIGEFPDYFLDTNTDMLQRCIPDGIIGLEDKNNSLPTFSLKFSKELNNFAKIFNSDFYNKARVLRIEKVESEQDILFQSGLYKSFDVEVFLNKTERSYKNDDSWNIIQDKRLRFIFEQGRGRIYWDGFELTKRLGFYTSLRWKGRWYDSTSKAIWEVESKDKAMIKATGRWYHLPIMQILEIKLKEDKFLELNIKMMVEEEIEFDRIQTNLMLSERYLQWIINEKEGYFPQFKDSIDDDWDCIVEDKDTKSIGVLKTDKSNNFLPSVIFLVCDSYLDGYLRIVNSDIYHRGRVLQYIDNRKVKIMPGEYLYFNGSIGIKD